jgi:hypothetical protein
VAEAPAGTQACSFDIKVFHRTCLIWPDHKPWLVISVNSEFYMDHCAPFGLRSASGSAGMICNAMVDIWDAGTGAIVPAGTKPDTKTFKFEDDLDKFRFPNAIAPAPNSVHTFRYHFDRQTVFAPIAPLRCPWHTKKTGMSFDDQTRFIGFNWDLPRRQVRLPEFKRVKYLVHVTTARRKARTGVQVPLCEVEELHGTLVHITFIFEEGSSHLPDFSNLFAGYRNKPYIRCKYSSTAICALD